MNFDELRQLVPVAPDWSVDWPSIWSIWPQFAALDECPQDPIYHAEGDVGEHTRMVVEALVSDPEWRGLAHVERELLFWTACLHDIGKPATTKKEEDGRITSKGHSRVGASIARDLLRGVAGVDLFWREALCELIVNHQNPFWILDDVNPERAAIRSAILVPGKMLTIHARADIRGRDGEGVVSIGENVELVGELYKELGCYEGAFEFPNDESRLGYIESEERHHSYAAFDANFRAFVTVMSGLPGSGKDTWIASNCPELPVISMDDIRKEMKVTARANQGSVVQEAFARARKFLAAGQDFAWNATNLSSQNKSKVTRLLRDYGAHIHFVYLEIDEAELWRRNRERGDEMLPNDAINKMIAGMELPTVREAHKVTHVLNGEVVQPQDSILVAERNMALAL